MGGLGGIIDWSGRSPSEATLRRMGGHLGHRGPDGLGQFVEGPAAFIKTARHVQGTEAGLPWVDDDLVVLLDGRLYGYEALCRAAGRTLPSESATEALAHAWRVWGAGACQRLEGAFAIAVWDRREQVLHLVRDRQGIRPLFWARDGDRFAFASELPALLDVPWVSRELAREHMAEYLSFRVVHAPRTLLRGVAQVEPAHWVRVTPQQEQARRYWAPLYAPLSCPRPAERDVIPALQEAVVDAVRRRLAGAPESALYLSGGLGSTAIAAACRRLTRQLPTFTVSFDDDAYPEAPFAGRVARLLGHDHHDVIVGSADLARAFDDAVRAVGHPVGNPAIVLQLLLARAASEHARVVLSGDGGEELFGGRMLDRFSRYLQLAQVFHRLPSATRRLLSVGLRQSERGRLIAADPAQYGLELEIGGSHLFSAAERQALLRDPALARPTVRHEVLQPFYADLDTDPVNAALHAYQRSWLSDDSLVRFDRTANAAGIDVRFPLLDRTVVDLAASLPGAFKLRRAGASLHSRWPLMAILDGVLPTALINRPKRGMPTPLNPWLIGSGRLFLEERFDALRRDRQRLWRVEFLDDLRRRLGRDPRAGIKLWALFLLDAWQRDVLGGRPSSGG